MWCFSWILYIYDSLESYVLAREVNIGQKTWQTRKLLFKTVGVRIFFLEESNTFFQQEYIKLIKIDHKDILLIKETWKNISKIKQHNCFQHW